MVFQDPLGALDPRLTIGAQIVEPLEIHRLGSKSERKGRVNALLADVGLRLGPITSGAFRTSFQAASASVLSWPERLRPIQISLSATSQYRRSTSRSRRK
ncbi:ABC-type glutathione transport system ATPase component [Bradyrhizobium sp. LM2.7]